MKNITVDGEKCSFELNKNHVYLANCIRRSLISDIESFAPLNITFEENTSCQPDEYIAHRIGLIAFHEPHFEENVDPSEEIMTFDVSGETFYAHHLQGSFKHTVDIPIIKLIDKQKVKGSVKFQKNCGSTHSRFCPVSAVGYEIMKDKIVFSFESINGENPVSHLYNAIKKIQNRVGNMKYQIELMKN